MTDGDGMIGWAWRWVRGLRVGVRGGNRVLEVVETMSLGGRRQLMLVRCEGKKFLVGCGGDSVQTIVAVKDEAER